MATNDLVLLTGSSGFIGFRTLVLTLKAGYRVRIAVRDDAKAKTITSHPVIKALNLAPDTLTTTIVPDFLANGAFDEAVKDVKYILHLASPIPRDLPADYDAKTYFIRPAVQGTLGILESAKKAPSVERIVVTSSVVAQIQPRYFIQETPDFVVDSESRTTLPDEYWVHPFVAYSASKIAALNEAEAWVKSNNPSFDVVHIHPGYVHGRNDLVSRAEDTNSGTNSNIISLALGTKDTAPKSGASVDVEDVARAHVDSLNRRIAGNQSFLLAKPVVWDHIPKIIAKNYPEAVEKGIISASGVQPTRPILTDVWKTEQAFGPLRDLEQQTISIVGQYLELKSAA